MKFYFIVPSNGDLPSHNVLEVLGTTGEVVRVIHRGRLSTVEGLKDDGEEKVLALDPVSFDWDLDAETLRGISGVRAVCTSSTSFDWMKPKVLREMGIDACNVPGFSSDSVAEYVVCMAIEVARRVPLMIKNKWKYSFDEQPMLLKGKVAGIVGLGRIGRRVAELCSGMGMEVIYWSRKSRDERFTWLELDALFRRADLVVPALVENEETRQIVTRERLDMMKGTTCLVGIARVSSIWDEKYVLEKVARGEIAGYAFEGEGAKKPSEYEGNVWSLPAMAWFTRDSLENLMKVWVENVRLASEGRPQNVVNL